MSDILLCVTLKDLLCQLFSFYSLHKREAKDIKQNHHFSYKSQRNTAYNLYVDEEDKNSQH